MRVLNILTSITDGSGMMKFFFMLGMSLYRVKGFGLVVFLLSLKIQSEKRSGACKT